MEIIAERVLLSVCGADRKQLRVLIGKPTPLENEGEFQCPLLIEGIHDSPRWAAGADGIQSLQLALVMVGVDLDAYVRETGAMISWYGEEGAGFPMPF